MVTLLTQPKLIAPGDSVIVYRKCGSNRFRRISVDTDQLKNSSSTFFPASFPSVASDKSALTSKLLKLRPDIYGNVGNATIDINGGATAKDIAAAITARKGETGVYADAQTRMNMSFEVARQLLIPYPSIFMVRMKQLY